MKIKLDKIAIMPQRAHPDDAGLDLYSTENFTVPAHGRVTINSGVHVAIPEGYVGLLTSKSGLMGKEGLTCRGTIDSGYTGPIHIVVFNHSAEPAQIKRGDKITQLVILPCIRPSLELVEELGETERGDGGFGSTGR